jgi:hypothetical protein
VTGIKELVDGGGAGAREEDGGGGGAREEDVADGAREGQGEESVGARRVGNGEGNDCGTCPCATPRRGKTGNSKIYVGQNKLNVKLPTSYVSERREYEPEQTW